MYELYDNRLQSKYRRRLTEDIESVCNLPVAIDPLLLESDPVGVSPAETLLRRYGH